MHLSPKELKEWLGDKQQRPFFPGDECPRPPFSYPADGEEPLMDAHCPVDQHLRVLNRSTGRLSRPDGECLCAECYRPLSPKEEESWRGDK